MTAPVLSVQGLTVDFATDRGPLRAVDGVSFSVAAGQTLAIVGESGCGKSATALAIMGLLPLGARLGGSVRLLGEEMVGRPAEAWRGRRGRDLAMVFQEPMTSLNPAFTVGEQVAEALRLHEGLSPRAAMERAVEMLARVRIPDAGRRARQYPHQLSGGMRQRVMIAMALACRPRLLVADEPTTALDVTVQAQILALLEELRRETGTAVVLITHDLGVVADHADQVAVMYAGRIAEVAPAAALFARPEHPYTIGLLGAAPSIEGGAGRLASIEGTVPDLRAPPPGCRFASRCPFAASDCAKQPPLAPVGDRHLTACWRAPLDSLLGVSKPLPPGQNLAWTGEGSPA
jgi:peptide/nickel transport system ATP-binding protein